MGHQANHDWHSMKGMDGFKGMPIFLIPIPMAMFGMCVAFMLGMIIGLLKGKKHGMAMYGGKEWMHHKGWNHRMGMGMGMGWKMRGMGHHHHGFGMPACCDPHEVAEKSEHASEQAPAEE